MQSEWNELLKSVDSLSKPQQLSILKKLKRIASRMTNEKYRNCRTIYLEMAPLQNSVLLLPNIECLHRLGFEAHDDPSVGGDKLKCTRVNVAVVSACTQCLEQRIDDIQLAFDHAALTPLGPSSSKESVSMQSQNEFYVPEPGQKEEEQQDVDIASVNMWRRWKGSDDGGPDFVGRICDGIW